MRLHGDRVVEPEHGPDYAIQTSVPTMGGLTMLHYCAALSLNTLHRADAKTHSTRPTWHT